MPFFEKVPLAPPDPILGLTQAFLRDPRPHKVNLGVGLFKDENLRTPIMAAVIQAEAQLQETHKEYLPIDGDPAYLEAMCTLVLGTTERTAAFQTLGGTGALHLGGVFLQETVSTPVWIPSPTWPNHKGVFTSCGSKVESYPHLDFSALCALPPGSIVLLHGCCHNPTGIDFTPSQWEEVAQICKQRRLIPFFDLAYQGLGDGLEADTFAVRYFFKQGFEMLVAVSNSKNFSLYSERIGCLLIVSERKEAIISRVKQLIRTRYSNPPAHGAKIVACVLRDPSLRASWETELDQMRRRLNAMRALLCSRLDIPSLKHGKGMFGYLGLSAKQVDTLITDYGIYMPSDGRVNVCGLNLNNIDRVVEAICKVRTYA